MKTCFLIFLVFCSVLTRASNYYVNPSSDSTKETGNITKPWKSLTSVNINMRVFKPGDTIFLKRGELYYENLLITCSGTENAPIVFTSYGPAPSKPVFLFKPSNGGDDYEAIRLRGCRFVVLDGFEITDDRMDPLNHASTAEIDIAVNIDSSNFIMVRNMVVSLVGVGVNIQGAGNTIDKCKFQNLRMIKNTVGGDDDYGANPVVISGPDNTISNCFFKDCWAKSFDYDYDGGAIEMFGSKTDNNKIINNTAINCDGFMEIGSLDEGSCVNNLVSHNIIINCGELVYISTGGKYKIAVQNLQFLDNIIIHSVNQLTNPKSMIGMQSNLTAHGIINLQNNIFWLTSGIDVGRKSQFLNGQMIHSNNIYYMSSGELNYPLGKAESIINKDSPVSGKILALHPELKNIDFLPFFYLLNILIKFIY